MVFEFEILGFLRMLADMRMLELLSVGVANGIAIHAHRRDRKWKVDLWTCLLLSVISDIPQKVNCRGDYFFISNLSKSI